MAKVASRTTQLLKSMSKSDDQLLVENKGIITFRLFSKKHKRVIGYFEPKPDVDIRVVIEAVQDYTKVDRDLIVIYNRINDDAVFAIMNADFLNVNPPNIFFNIENDGRLLFVINMQCILDTAGQRAEFLLGVGCDKVMDVTPMHAFNSGKMQLSLKPQQPETHVTQPLLHRD